MSRAIVLEIQKHLKEIRDKKEELQDQIGESVYDAGFVDGQFDAYDDLDKRLEDLLRVAAGVYEDAATGGIPE